MDIQKSLGKIKENQQKTISELVDRWNKIFTEYQVKLASGNEGEASEYLARHMGEMDLDFGLYFIPYIDMLKKKGIKEGAEIQERLASNFRKLYENFRIKRSSEIAKNAFKVTEEISKNWKSKE